MDRTAAGMVGELRVLHELEDCMTDEPFTIIHGLQFLNHVDHPCQIDLLLITTRYVLIIEVKNISGTLYYDKSLRQFSRKLIDQEPQHLKNPFDQILRHYEFVCYLLKNANIEVPLVSLVVNANTNSIMDTSLRGEPIINISSLRYTLRTLRQKYSQMLSITNLEKLGRFFESQNVFYEGKRYVPTSLIQHGVLCPTCNFQHLMVYDSRTWRCFNCHRNNRKALKLALRDYRILIGDLITNQTFRDWTGITNSQTATKLLLNLSFEAKGATKARIYTIPQEYMFISDT